MPPSVARLSVDGSGPKRRPCGCGRLLEAAHDHAGLDDGGARLGVDLADAVHVPGEVEDDAGADGVARHRRAAAAGRDRGAGLAGDGERGEDVVGVARADDDLRDHAVVRGVRGVLGAAAGGVVHLAGDGVAEGLHEVGAGGVRARGTGARGVGAGGARRGGGIRHEHEFPTHAAGTRVTRSPRVRRAAANGVRAAGGGRRRTGRFSLAAPARAAG